MNICKHCNLRLGIMMSIYPNSDWKEAEATIVVVSDEECENDGCQRERKSD